MHIVFGVRCHDTAMWFLFLWCVYNFGTVHKEFYYIASTIFDLRGFDPIEEGLIDRCCFQQSHAEYRIIVNRINAYVAVISWYCDLCCDNMCRLLVVVYLLDLVC